MQPKKIGQYILTGITTLSILFFGLNIPLAFLDSKWGLDFYHFIILGMILYPLLYYYLTQETNKKEFPIQFLWFITLITIGTIPSLLLVHETYLLISGRCSDWCGATLIVNIPFLLVLYTICFGIYRKTHLK